MTNLARTSPVDLFLTAAETNPNAWFEANREEQEALFDAVLARMLTAEKLVERARALAVDLLASVTAATPGATTA